MGADWSTRVYASSIAIVSGLYAIGSAAVAMVSTPMMTDAALGIGRWIMLVLGIIVLVHGLVLVTPAADRLGRRSGPLMVIWAVVMLLNQGLSAAMSGWTSMMAGMRWDAGMLAIAVLMLTSGLIMTRQELSSAAM